MLASTTSQPNQDTMASTTKHSTDTDDTHGHSDPKRARVESSSSDESDQEDPDMHIDPPPPAKATPSHLADVKGALMHAISNRYLTATIKCLSETSGRVVLYNGTFVVATITIHGPVTAFDVPPSGISLPGAKKTPLILFEVCVDVETQQTNFGCSMDELAQYICGESSSVRTDADVEKFLKWIKPLKTITGNSELSHASMIVTFDSSKERPDEYDWGAYTITVDVSEIFKAESRVKSRGKALLPHELYMRLHVASDNTISIDKFQLTSPLTSTTSDSMIATSLCAKALATFNGTKYVRVDMLKLVYRCADNLDIPPFVIEVPCNALTRMDVHSVCHDPATSAEARGRLATEISRAAHTQIHSAIPSYRTAVTNAIAQSLVVDGNQSESSSS